MIMDLKCPSFVKMLYTLIKYSGTSDQDRLCFNIPIYWAKLVMH